MLEQIEPITTDTPTAFEPQTSFCLRPLLRVWEEIAAGRRFGNSSWATQLLDELRSAPELSGDVVTEAHVKKHQKLVDSLMSSLFAPAMQERQMLAVMAPYRFDVMYASPGFREQLFQGAMQGALEAALAEPRMRQLRQLSMYLTVAEQVYGLKIPLDRSVTMPVSAEGKLRYYQFRAHNDFVEVVTRQPVPPLTDEQVAELRRNIANPDFLREFLPFDKIEVRGFSLVEITDVSRQEAFSQLRHLLLSQEALLRHDTVEKVQEQLRSLLNLPSLVMRLAGREAGKVYTFNTGCNDINKLLESPTCAVFRGHMDQMLDADCPTACVVDDISTIAEPDGMMWMLSQQGYRSALMAPLVHEGKASGVLMLASTGAGDFDPLTVLRLDDVTQLFAMAVQRSFDSLNMQVQAVIKERFTSIHPAVEWKFRDAALAQIRSEGKRDATEEAIAFNDVYPLYGVSDIRSSSTLRNQAMRADLLEQLGMARDLLRHAEDLSGLPYVGNLTWLVEKCMARIEPGLTSGDEIGVVEFLKRDIEPLFDSLAALGPTVRERIEAYREAVDARVGMLYRRRRDFDESVTCLNDMIAAHLYRSQEGAQAVLPHYFETRKTDGVDHNIYVGASILERGQFDTLQLRNLRLWQLIVMCEVAQRSEAMRPLLKMPLEMAHLVLVQHTPLSISFQVDEKQFAVAGAYDVRYEIMKKRIDKAVVLGSGERLTQPRMLSIAYSHRREGDEYMTYLQYLQSKGYLEDRIEELELAELPGAHGLRAMRVLVRTAES
jgi:hypothetical protein